MIKTGTGSAALVGAMKRVDLVIIALVVVAVVGSAIGVTWYDSDGVSRYDVRIEEQEDSEDGWTTTLTGPGGADDNDWTLDRRNLTHVSFTISISSTLTPRTQDTEVTFEISHPDANISTQSTTLVIPSNADTGSDEDTVSFDIQEVPSGEGGVLAGSAAAALLDDSGEDLRVPATMNGTGEWTIDARVTAGGSSATIGGQTLGEENIQVDVDLVYRFYTARAEPQVPDISPAG